MNGTNIIEDCPACHQPMRVFLSRAQDGALTVSEECATCDHRDVYEILDGEEENSCLA